jgi:single-strand DNA-binding protein
MEHLNKIELRGIIGSVYVKDFVNAKVANFSVATDYCYTAQDGTKVIECTWHRVIAWEGNQIRNLTQLKKGSAVHVIGRLRVQRYTGADGCDRTAYEILASTVELVDESR